jgi:hypothetical protein
LEASHSWSAAGDIIAYEWRFTDGETASGVQVERTYPQPGKYEEILKITDSAGKEDYDFALVQVLDPEQPERYTPSLHLAFAPSLNLKPGDAVTFPCGPSVLTAVKNTGFRGRQSRDTDAVGTKQGSTRPERLHLS